MEEATLGSKKSLIRDGPLKEVIKFILRKGQTHEAIYARGRYLFLIKGGF